MLGKILCTLVKVNWWSLVWHDPSGLCDNSCRFHPGLNNIMSRKSSAYHRNTTENPSWGDFNSNRTRLSESQSCESMAQVLCSEMAGRATRAKPRKASSKSYEKPNQQNYCQQKKKKVDSSRYECVGLEGKDLHITTGWEDLWETEQRPNYEILSKLINTRSQWKNENKIRCYLYNKLYQQQSMQNQYLNSMVYRRHTRKALPSAGWLSIRNIRNNSAKRPAYSWHKNTVWTYLCPLCRIGEGLMMSYDVWAAFQQV